MGRNMSKCIDVYNIKTMQVSRPVHTAEKTPVIIKKNAIFFAGGTREMSDNRGRVREGREE
jgi:hypothetical protein